MKKIIGEWKQRSVFHYVISFSIIVVFIILVMGTYLYRFYYRTIYNDFVTTNESYVTSMESRHENDISVVHNIVLQMGLSNNVTDFSLTRYPLKSIDLKKQLYQYTMVSEFFNQVFYFYHGDTYLYNHVTSVEISRFLKEGLVLGQTSADTFRSLLYSEESGLKIIPEQSIDGYLAIRYRNLSTQAVAYLMPIEPKKTSTMLFVISSLYYDDLLDAPEEDLRKNLIFYEDQPIVVRNMDSSTAQEAVEKVSGIGDYDKIKLAGKEYLAVIKHGESGLMYCTLQSMEIFQNKVFTNQWGIFVLLLICSVPSSMALVTLSKTLTGKMHKLTQLLEDGDSVNCDFGHIETGIRTLVEMNKEVTKASIPLKRSKFISSFIRNEYTDSKGVIAAGERAGLLVKHSYFTVALMGSRENVRENKLYEAILEKLGQEEKVEGYGITLIIHNQSLVVLFGDDMQQLERVLEELFEIGKGYCEDFIMAVSEYHKDLLEGSQAYLEADAAYDNRFLVDNNRIIRFGDIASKEHVEVLPEAYLQRLKNAIRTGDKEEANAVIEEICRTLQSGNLSLLTFRLIYNDIIHMLIMQWNADASEFKHIYSVFTLSQCLTMKDFNDVLCEVCNQLMESCPASKNPNADMVKEAVDYMKKNYQNPDLTMTALAEYLNVSPVGLAVGFKNGMGMSPSDYLTIIRMECAKELLKETEMHIKEVGAEVGYEDDHVFMRRFKKYVGKTPGEFRKNREGVMDV